MTQRRCDCESSSCHPKANCQGAAEVRTIHSRICRECAVKMPAEYLVALTPLEALEAMPCPDCEHPLGLHVDERGCSQERGDRRDADLEINVALSPCYCQGESPEAKNAIAVIRQEKAQKHGFLEVGTDDRGEVILNLDRDRTGHITFSPIQARALANSLFKQARIAERMLSQ